MVRLFRGLQIQEQITLGEQQKKAPIKNNVNYIHTVEPVLLSGAVLRGHPLLSGHVVKSPKLRNINPINMTLIKRSPY